ncbi:MAG: ATP-binding protein [Bilophila wadsworthia]
MICDDGPGIPQADIARVFERFYRVEKYRSSPASTGLGLAICKHIVERHGGRSGRNPPPAAACNSRPSLRKRKKGREGHFFKKGPSPKSTMPSRRLRPPKT